MFTLTEVRNAVRSLAHAPTVSASAVVCLALGIGATTAISSAINRALLQPLPFPDADRLVAVHRVTPQSGPQGTWPQSAAELPRSRARRTADPAICPPSQGDRADQSRRARRFRRASSIVTGGLFPMLGARAERGRLIGPRRRSARRAAVAVLSDEFWRTKLGADPAVVGKSLIIDGTPTTIVGIPPPDFRVPLGGKVLRADVWMPMRFTRSSSRSAAATSLLLIGRLAPGATPASAGAEMHGLFATRDGRYPELRGEDLRVAPLQAESAARPFGRRCCCCSARCAWCSSSRRRTSRRCCSRAASIAGARWRCELRSARRAGRRCGRRSSRVRSSRRRRALGMALAVGGVRTIGRLAGARMPQLAGLRLDGRVVAFALALAVVVAVACGAVPAWRSAAVDPQDALRGGRGGGAGASTIARCARSSSSRSLFRSCC